MLRIYGILLWIWSETFRFLKEFKMIKNFNSRKQPDKNSSIFWNEILCCEILFSRQVHIAKAWILGWNSVFVFEIRVYRRKIQHHRSFQKYVFWFSHTNLDWFVRTNNRVMLKAESNEHKDKSSFPRSCLLSFACWGKRQTYNGLQK